MAINLISIELHENTNNFTAVFGNPDNSSEQGVLAFELLSIEPNGDKIYSFFGVNTNVDPIQKEEIIPSASTDDDDNINATKVFLFVAKVLKSVLCPTCA